VTESVVLRDMRSDDNAFVRDSWLRSHFNAHPERDVINRRVHLAGQSRRIDRLLERSIVRIAAYEDDSDLVLGWVCVENERVHYVYVKKLYRKQGIARMLLSDLLPRPCLFSHRVTGLRAPDRWAYDPWSVD
jgi:GNAT superfamily N-acetyltransferase